MNNMMLNIEIAQQAQNRMVEDALLAAGVDAQASSLHAPGVFRRLLNRVRINLSQGTARVERATRDPAATHA